MVDAIAYVIFYGANILIGAFQMAFSSDQAALKAQIAFYWESLMAVAEGLVKTLSDIFFDMLFHMGDMGARSTNSSRSRVRTSTLPTVIGLRCGAA